jgi:hypothetical protein
LADESCDTLVQPGDAAALVNAAAILTRAL